MHGDGCCVADRIAPDRLEELFTTERSAWVRDEMGEKVELLRRQRENRAVEDCFVRDEVDSQPARCHDGSDGRHSDPRRSPEHCLDTSGELPRRERLCDVVVGAELEPCHPIFL